MPGATLDSVDGDEIAGRIKVKVGPIQMTYAGTAKFTERDKDAGVVVLEASGKETRGAGTASASVRSQLTAEGDQTHVTVHTNLNVTGKPAQFGRGVMAEVGGRLVGIFADNLASMLAAGQQEAAAGSSAAAHAPTAPEPAGGATDEALPIDVLNLGTRAWSSLRQDGIQTLGDLTRRTAQQLLAIENIGPSSLADIRSRLADRGLALSAEAAPAAKSPTPEPGTAAEIAPAASPTANGDRSTAPEVAPVTPLRPVPAAAGPESATEQRAAPPAWQPPNDDALDLLNVAGPAVLKRIVPAAAAGLVLVFVLLGRRLRRARRR
jgi:carbon monoxide dehydrogenase subunit G